MLTNFRLWRAALVFLALAAGAAHAKPAAPSIAQLAAFPRMASFSIAPDGKHLAALEARGEDRVILVWKTDELDKPPTAIGTQRMKITSVQFIKNDMLAVTMYAALRRAPRQDHQDRSSRSSSSPTSRARPGTSRCPRSAR